MERADRDYEFLDGAVMDVAGADMAAPHAADIDMWAFTEMFKPEDHTALNDIRRPRVVVLNKADLLRADSAWAGSVGGGLPELGCGSLAAAVRHCEKLRRQTGVEVHPLASLAAIAGCDEAVVDNSLAALQVLLTDPVDLGSTDGFLDSHHVLPKNVRARLLTELDLHGIAQALSVLRRGGARQAIMSALRGGSGIDDVLSALDRASSAIDYRRIIAAIGVLEVHAARPGDRNLPAFLCSDEVVAVRMVAAREVLRAAGFNPGGLEFDGLECGGLEPDKAVDAAVSWQRSARGFLTPLYRACAADLVRGLLRCR
jgi:hypothetical protein